MPWDYSFSAGRSGTSLLTGLLSLASGYATGDKDELILPRATNAKGYFERKDVVNQNIQLLKLANASHMDANFIQRYIPTQNMSLFSREGKRALAFLNNSTTTIPWIVKDPRLSVTLKDWLPSLKSEPAILITYRHPLEVARSWQRRDKMALSLGLDVWTATNEALLRNSAGLCRVVTNNNAILQGNEQDCRGTNKQVQSVASTYSNSFGIRRKELCRYRYAKGFTRKLVGM